MKTNKNVTASDVAKYFIKKSSTLDESDLTNLKLQKLLYFAQGEYLATKSKKLFDDEIEAWDLGPVVRSVYGKYKHCGAYPITAFDTNDNNVDLPLEVTSFLDKVWDKWSKFSARYLVDETHKPNSPWAETYKESGDKIIAEEKLKTYFSSQS